MPYFTLPLTNNDLAAAWLVQRLANGSHPADLIERLTTEQAQYVEAVIGQLDFQVSQILGACGLDLEDFSGRAGLINQHVALAHAAFCRVLAELRPSGHYEPEVSLAPGEAPPPPALLPEPGVLGPDHDPA